MSMHCMMPVIWVSVPDMRGYGQLARRTHDLIELAIERVAAGEARCRARVHQQAVPPLALDKHVASANGARAARVLVEDREE